MKKCRNYKYKIYNAEICIRCLSVRVLDMKMGIIGCICGKCNKALRKQFKAWNKTGIYLGKQDKKAVFVEDL